MTVYIRPLVQFGPQRPRHAMILAGGPMWFSEVAVHRRGDAPEILPVRDVPDADLARLCAPRAPIAGLEWDQPRLMGILNITPDSFSDGGQFDSLDTAMAQAQVMARHKADIVDIGGESTRPGATPVALADEIARTAPVIAAIRAQFAGAISIDTRKAAVARAALQLGATVVNDVSALGYDPDMAGFIGDAGCPVVLMHAQGRPETMQQAPRYDDVVLDVYDALAAHIHHAVAAGIARDRIIIDPGIGFGKTLDHNLALLAHLSLFHGLGCPILLGASRKRFIGTLGDAPNPGDRAPGSIAVALAGVAQGVQMLRVHDIAETRQALTLWWAAMTGAQA